MNGSLEQRKCGWCQEPAGGHLQAPVGHPFSEVLWVNIWAPFLLRTWVNTVFIGKFFYNDECTKSFTSPYDFPGKGKYWMVFSAHILNKRKWCSFFSSMILQSIISGGNQEFILFSQHSSCESLGEKHRGGTACKQTTRKVSFRKEITWTHNHT